jgi:hypothetical protein
MRFSGTSSLTSSTAGQAPKRKKFVKTAASPSAWRGLDGFAIYGEKPAHPARSGMAKIVLRKNIFVLLNLTNTLRLRRGMLMKKLYYGKIIYR